ncbi:MAG: response regulator [Candidatus Melainabacteria bacterium]|nr:response regulator [Candidatus Melainabacteria bacterium]
MKINRVTEGSNTNPVQDVSGVKQNTSVGQDPLTLGKPQTQALTPVIGISPLVIEVEQARSLLEVYKKGLHVLNHEARNPISPIHSLLAVVKATVPMSNKNPEISKLEDLLKLLAVGEVSGEDAQLCLLDEWCAIAEQEHVDPREILQQCISHGKVVEQTAKLFLDQVAKVVGSIEQLPKCADAAKILANNSQRFYEYISKFNQTGGLDYVGRPDRFSPSYYLGLTIDSARSNWTGLQMNLVFNDKDDVEEIKMDSGYFQACIDNLISNSAKAFQRAGIASEDAVCTVRIMQEQKSGSVIIQVEDNGPGISPEHLGQLFDEGFSTTIGESKGASDTGSGTNKGIGLSAVKKYIEAAGGTINVSTSVGEEHGTMFTIEIPPFREDKPVMSVLPLQAVQNETRSDDLDYRVLIVDRNSDFSTVSGMLLDQVTYGRCGTDCARDHEEALKMMELNSYDLVVTDISFGLGNMSGIEFIDKINTTVNDPPRTVLCSVYDTDEIQEAFPEIKTEDILVKGSAKDDLVSRILPPQLVKEHKPEFNLLIVDQNKDFRTVIRKLFDLYSNGKCRIDTVPDIESAIALLQQRKYDSVMTDINFGTGKMSGMDLMGSIRDMGLDDIRVVFCSSFNPDEVTERFPQVHESNVFVRILEPLQLARGIFPVHLVE